MIKDKDIYLKYIFQYLIGHVMKQFLEKINIISFSKLTDCVLCFICFTRRHY